MTNAEVASLIFDILNFGATASIAFVGWKIAFNNDSKIAFRGEIYESIRVLEEKIESLVCDSVSYWKSESISKEYIRYESLDFELRVEAISKDIRNLAQRGYAIDNHFERIFEFRRAITLDTLYFDRTSQEDKIKKIRDIYSSMDEIISALHGIFTKRHINASS